MLIDFCESAQKAALSQAEDTDQEANVTANMTHQEADSVSEEAVRKRMMLMKRRRS